MRELKASVAVDYLCKECGEFQVIHAGPYLNRACYHCLSPVVAIRIAYVGLRDEQGEWIRGKLDETLQATTALRGGKTPKGG